MEFGGFYIGGFGVLGWMGWDGRGWEGLEFWVRGFVGGGRCGWLVGWLVDRWVGRWVDDVGHEYGGAVVRYGGTGEAEIRWMDRW